MMTRNRLAAAICLGLLATFTLIAWRAVSTKSPTWDEVDHAPAAWTHLWYHDFRLDCENPPLWKYWAALPNPKSSLSADFHSSLWADQPRYFYLEWEWCVRTLFRTPGNNAEQFIARSRAMMLVLGVGLGTLIGWWAWRLRGALAAIVATAFYCFDPNFLAHAPLVKNDVAFSLALLGLIYWIWRAGHRLNWTRAIVLGLLCGTMLTVKLSGVLGAALIPLMLAIRSLLPCDWHAFGKSRTSRLAKLNAAVIASVISAAIAIAFVWAVYGFRFAPTPDPSIRLNVHNLVHDTKWNEILSYQGTVNEQEVAAMQSSVTIRCILFANRHQLLPHAWLIGLLYQYRSALIHKAFLLGDNSFHAWWYYFPIAMAVKTPLATIAAIALACLIAWIAAPRKWWTILCLVVPVIVYMTLAMHSHLNIGFRHVLPVYPFAFIVIGCTASVAWQRWPRRASAVTLSLVLLLVLESLSAFPNYIAFFNLAAGGSHGGLHLLGDSNLDWGQDLKLLAAWQQKNPNVNLYLSYFGTADPAYYGIKYVPLVGGYLYDKNRTLPSSPGVIAISASILQGLSHDPQADPTFQKMLLNLRPIQILGGTIYLYRWPPQRGDLLPAPGSTPD
jgi:hypothetical protein